jgi:predicted RNase H-like HicB family nuclease
MKDMKGKVSIVIEHDAHGYYAYCPELRGCQSEGATFEEVRANIQEAMELYIETLTPQEWEAVVSKDIYTSAIEVSFG